MANTVAYGFLDLQHLFAERLVEVDAEVITTAITETAAEHARQIDALLGFFAERTTRRTARFQQGKRHRLQPLDEFGRARPVAPAGYYDVAFPIYDAGTAWGATFKALNKMTVADASRVTSDMMNADKEWLRDQLLAALYSNQTYAHTDAEGSLTIQPLALASDNVAYPRVGSTVSATDTHHLAQANAIGDAADDPFPTIYAELTEHPENAGDVVALIPTNLKADVADLALVHDVADPNIRRGADNDELTGTLGVATPGDLFGYHSAKVWLVEWKNAPDNYIIATTTGGIPPLRMREEPEANLQGFYRAAERNDHPYYETQWARHAGFGAFNRVGAVVYRIGSASYAEPTGYTAPIW